MLETLIVVGSWCFLSIFSIVASVASLEALRVSTCRSFSGTLEYVILVPPSHIRSSVLWHFLCGLVGVLIANLLLESDSLRWLEF